MFVPWHMSWPDCIVTLARAILVGTTSPLMRSQYNVMRTIDYEHRTLLQTDYACIRGGTNAYIYHPSCSYVHPHTFPCLLA